MGARVWVRAHNGLEMTVEYVSFLPPELVAVKMIDGARMLRTFGATARHPRTAGRTEASRRGTCGTRSRLTGTGGFMRTKLVLIVVACIGLIVAAAPMPDPSAVETRISIRPVTHDQYQLLRRTRPGMYRCSVRIAEQEGSALWWGPPDLILGPGEKGEVSRARGELRVIFMASISKNTDHADATVTVFRGAKVVAKQAASVSLVKNPQTAEPLQ